MSPDTLRFAIARVERKYWSGIPLHRALAEVKAPLGLPLTRLELLAERAQRDVEMLNDAEQRLLACGVCTRCLWPRAECACPGRAA